MKYPTCSTCAYFLPCSYSNHCKLIYSSNGEPECTTSLATAKDYEGYSASLEVQSNFGCIQHSDLSTTQHIFTDEE